MRLRPLPNPTPAQTEDARDLVTGWLEATGIDVPIAAGHVLVEWIARAINRATPTPHTSAWYQAEAVRLLSSASYFTADPAVNREARSTVQEAALLTAQAQVYATLATITHAPPQE